ncbi:MAG TPA: HAD family hydrolase [Rectinemataceae bacterium]|nr:HAD family hydrolase [Rectinemataceae bacterium]
MAERDFAAAWPLPARAAYLAGTSIEIVRAPRLSAPPEHALFDFDGTLSLIREGWMDIMVPMMVEILSPFARKGESENSLEALARDFVTRLTGKQTIYQMMRLADEIRSRGGEPRDPRDYKAEYHERLMARIDRRRRALSDGSAEAESMLVPGSLDILRSLAERGVRIYIASGTDESFVLEEARLLGLGLFAEGTIYGALADPASFSKEMVIARILAENRVEGSRLVAFGDGYVEISDCKAAGGLAVAVASDEAGRSGAPDPWKRERLIGAGADLVIPDYREQAALVDYIWEGGRP